MRNKNTRMTAVAIAALLGANAIAPLVTTARADFGPGDMSRAPFVQNESFGLGYGDWSARWWEWLLSIPAATNPNIATGKMDCSVGQAGDVWFLAGSFGATVQRSCAVPQGKALFFPMINTIVYKPLPTETLNDLRRQASVDFIDKTTSLKCTIDGMPCAFDLRRFRASSPTFSIIAPKDGFITPDDLKPRPEIVSDGYWMMLKPLPARGAPYTIRFGGTANGATVDVTYRLFVTGK